MNQMPSDPAIRSSICLPASWIRTDLISSIILPLGYNTSSVLLKI